MTDNWLELITNRTEYFNVYNKIKCEKSRAAVSMSTLQEKVLVLDNILAKRYSRYRTSNDENSENSKLLKKQNSFRELSQKSF
jgi:hypothetical protein